MGASNRVHALVLDSVNAAALGAYQPLITLTESIFLLRIVNDSNTAVFISYDGVNDHDYIAPNGSLQIDFQTNAAPNNWVALMPKNRIVYVRGVAGVGLIAASGYYVQPL